MEWTVDDGPGREYAMVLTRGVFSTDDHRRMVEDIVSRDSWQPGRDVLFDHRLLEFGDSGFAAMQRAAENHLAHDICIGDGKAAVLMKSLADYGRGRQFELLTDGRVGAQLQIFRDEAEALRWLLE